MEYCRNLKFDQEPDYAYMISIFRDLAKAKQLDLDDGVFDWSVKATCILKYP